MFCGNREIAGPSAQRAVVFQNHSLLPWLTCYENVYLAVEAAFGALERKSQLKACAKDALALVGLRADEQKRPHKIYGGMRQRVGIARALSMEPKVLLMDELLGGLDALTRARLQDELLNVIAKINPTVVMVTQDVDEAVLLSDRVVVMSNSPNSTIAATVDIPLERPCSRLGSAQEPSHSTVVV